MNEFADEFYNCRDGYRRNVVGKSTRGFDNCRTDFAVNSPSYRDWFFPKATKRNKEIPGTVDW